MPDAARRVKQANLRSARNTKAERHQSSPQVFSTGEVVRVARKSRVVDKARAHEGRAPGALRPIDVDVTGAEGVVCGAAYASSLKDGKTCVPVELRDGNIIGVPVDRLERGAPPLETEKSENVMQRGSANLSTETVDFWRNYFKSEDENKRLKEENARLREGVNGRKKNR